MITEKLTRTASNFSSSNSRLLWDINRTVFSIMRLSLWRNLTLEVSENTARWYSNPDKQDGNSDEAEICRGRCEECNGCAVVKRLTNLCAPVSFQKSISRVKKSIGCVPEHNHSFSSNLTAELSERLIKNIMLFRKLFAHETLHIVALTDDRLNLEVRTYLNGIRMDINGGMVENLNAPALEFLLGSLVRRPSMRQRHSIYYLTTHSWRQNMKKHQISAIRSLKAQFSYRSVEMVSDRILDVLDGFMGEMNVDFVAGMPCSHSPPEKCFSSALAICIANKLNKQWIDLLEIEAQTGSSHPANNANRPPITLKSTVEGSVLLVDDVVTSGDHMEEAVKTLRTVSNTVFAVGWIGGEVSLGET